MARMRETVGLPVLIDPEVPHYRGDMETDLGLVARDRLAERITGGLSAPSKMPCPAWGISAARCRVGQVLAQEAGTVCHSCYATQGTYRFSSVQLKLEERFHGLSNPLWTPAMVFLIRYFCGRYFRWFDSGDLMGVRHLHNILTICRHTRDVLHWLPTREYLVVRNCDDEIPDNLTIRVSAHQIDGEPPPWWPTTSTVTSMQAGGVDVCPARDQGNSCDECRACWDGSIANVAYRLH